MGVAIKFAEGIEHARDRELFLAATKTELKRRIEKGIDIPAVRLRDPNELAQQLKHEAQVLREHERTR
jgi:hypothetical protein